MNLKLMFVLVTWICVTIGLVTASSRLTGVEPRTTRMVWTLALMVAYLCCLFLNGYHSSQRNKPWLITLSPQARQYVSVPGYLYVMDQDAFYVEESPDVLRELVSIDPPEIFVELAEPSAYAGRMVQIINGRWADEQKKERDSGQTKTP